MYYEYLVDVDMVSVEWLQSIVSGPPAIIQQAKEKLRTAIAALSRNSGKADQQQEGGANTIKNFARTTMLTRMINGYLALEAASDTPVVCETALGMAISFRSNYCVFFVCVLSMCCLAWCFSGGCVLTCRPFLPHTA